MTVYHSVDRVIEIAEAELGSPAPVRDLGLLDSAVARPRSSVFGQDAYPDIWTKAAALLQSLVVNHALVDGNKRLGWMSCVVFVALNVDIDLTAVDEDDAYALVIDVATDSSLTVEDLAPRLRSILGG